MIKKSLLFNLLCMALSIPAVWQVITPGYFPMHDDAQIVRIFEMYKALHPPVGGSQFPVRWVPDLGYGYGYPIFNFYNPLPYYVGSLPMFFGLDALSATKLMFVFPILGSFFSMYLFARLKLSKWGALSAGLLYLYAPYHGVQIYVRGSVAEYWAYALLPLLFWALLKRKVIIGGIILAALITSHNLTAFMSIPFIALLITLQLLRDNKRRLLFTVYCLLFTLGLGLSAFFWIPAIFEASKTRVSEMVFKEFDPPALHLIAPFQLWSSPWGYGGSSPGLDDGLSFQLGKIHLLGSFAAVAMWLFGYMIKQKNQQQSDYLTAFTILGLFFSLFFLFPFSAPIWNTFPFLAYIQFPWRFLTFASLFSSYLAAVSLEHIMENIKHSQLFYLLLFTFYLFFPVYSFKFFQPRFKFPTTVEEQTSREKIVWEVSRRSDEYLPRGFQRPSSFEEALRKGNEQNQILVNALKQQTPIRIAGDIISVASIAGVFLCLVQSRKRLWNTK